MFVGFWLPRSSPIGSERKPMSTVAELSCWTARSCARAVRKEHGSSTRLSFASRFPARRTSAAVAAVTLLQAVRSTDGRRASTEARAGCRNRRHAIATLHTAAVDRRSLASGGRCRVIGSLGAAQLTRITLQRSKRRPPKSRATISACSRPPVRTMDAHVKAARSSALDGGPDARARLGVAGFRARATFSRPYERTRPSAAEGVPTRRVLLRHRSLGCA